MESMQKREGDILDKLAAQAHMFVQGACMNLLQLGRVLTEAKPLVAHGEWDNWIRTNAKMSRRTAEQYMQAYAEFGLNSQIAELGTTKVLKLLPMPQEDRDRLLSENDVAGMSTRQLEAAIKEQKDRLIREAREKVQEEIDSEREARRAAEKRAAEAENRPPEVPQEVQDELQAAREREKTQRAEIDRINATRDSERERLQRENDQLRRDIKDLDATLEEQQEDYNRAQEELLNLKSTIAKGDAERVPVDHLTVDTFASAVRAFIGTCARMPQMDATFSAMDLVEKNAYDELLRTMESWARDSRKALDTVTIEGTVIINE
jgi:hypothetical protein